MMLAVIEQYFLAHGALVLPCIGHLSLHQTDATRTEGHFQPPVQQIIFDPIVAPTTKPSKLFYMYLSDHLDCTVEQAMIDYAAFFTTQIASSGFVDLGNLGRLTQHHEQYAFISHFNSGGYFQTIHIEKVLMEDQSENNFNTTSKQWWILPLFIAVIAIVAILLK